MSTFEYNGQYIIVFGTASLQRYIFQSNRLKEIVGASYLAKHWFDRGLIASIKQIGCSFDTSAWDNYKKKPSMLLCDAPDIADVDVNLIYVGGGNAALLCKSQEIVQTIIKVWSLNLLKKAPGIRGVVGYCEIEESFTSAYRKALDDLKACEESLPFGAPLGSLPVVRSCATTGLPANVFSREENDINEWISQSAACKRKEVGYIDHPGRARKNIANEFKSVLKEEKRFAIELDKELGGSEGQSYIAVVHADGNGMGGLLNKVIDQEYERSTDFLHYLRAFSSSISMLSKSALEKTLLYFRDALPLEGLRLRENVFPFRPIVYGGDDLTFVCDGRVGLPLTEYYLQRFSEGNINVCGKEQSVDACAGVAIVHTKFPIAQAYHFADELCGLAKTRRREKNANNNETVGSWLDFQIIQEGATSSITSLREAQYRSLDGEELHQRPYQVPNEWNKFTAILKDFRLKWPRNRAKGLLEVLTKGKTATQKFVNGAEWRGLDVSMCEPASDCFDPLEAIDFYLEELLPPDTINDVGEKGT